MKNVMERAWEIAREGQINFGGRVSEYLSVALKIAWSEIKNKEVTVSWKNDRGIEIEMTVKHVTKRVLGYNELLQQNTVKKVDEMKITKLVLGGEEVSTWNTTRSYDQKTITTGLVEFRGRKATITIDLPAHINQKVWGEYDKRQAKKQAVINRINEEQQHMDKVYNVLECGA